MAGIPRSRLWDRLRESLRPVLKSRIGDAWGRIAEGYHWAAVFLNYVLMRGPVFRSLFRTGAWPQSLYIEGTNICNARCVFCAYPKMSRAKAVMPLELFKRAVDQYVALGGSEVDLTPIVGDPFVDHELFAKLDYLCSLPGVRRFHFFTNAILIGPEHLDRLAGYGGRLTVYCSFGGFNRETYRRVMGVDKFEEAVAGIRGLVETKRRTGSAVGVQVNLRCPPGNAKGEFWNYVAAARDAELVTVDSIDTFDSWAGTILDEDLIAAGLTPRPMPVKKGPCHHLLTGPVVLVDGRVNACVCRDAEAQLVIGDLKTQGLEDILNGPALRELLVRHERDNLPEVCRKCTFYDSLYPGWLRGRLFPLISRLFR